MSVKWEAEEMENDGIKYNSITQIATETGNLKYFFAKSFQTLKIK